MRYYARQGNVGSHRLSACPLLFSFIPVFFWGTNGYCGDFCCHWHTKTVLVALDSQGWWSWSRPRFGWVQQIYTTVEAMIIFSVASFRRLVRRDRTGVPDTHRRRQHLPRISLQLSS